MDSSAIPQELWQQAVSLLDSEGTPVTPETIQGAIKLISAGGGVSPAPKQASVSTGDSLDGLMARTDGIKPVPVTSAPLSASTNRRPAGVNGFLAPTRGGAAKSAQQVASMKGKGGQGPMRADVPEADNPDGRVPSKQATNGNTENTPPGMQDDTVARAERGVLTGGSPEEDASGMELPSIGDPTTAAAFAALIATLTKKKNAPSLGQAIHLGGYQAKPAMNQYEGTMTPSTPQEIKKAARSSSSRRGGGRGGGGMGGNRVRVKGRGVGINPTLDEFLY